MPISENRVTTNGAGSNGSGYHENGSGGNGSNGSYSNGSHSNGDHSNGQRALSLATIGLQLHQPRPLIAPRAIAKGEAIGVVAPSYSPRTGPLMRGVNALERAGYEVILDPDIAQLRRFQRQEDERRASNFMGMWLDPRIKAVIGGTGGYGAVRMLPYLEPEIFTNNPKIFVGYSDITALHLWLMRQAGLRVFHGPTVDDLIPIARDPTTSSLLTALTTPRPPTGSVATSRAR
jgi:hypothetical protein